MKILVAAHNEKIRQALRLLLEEEFEAEVAEADSIEDLGGELTLFRPGLVVISWRMIQADAFDQLIDLRSREPQVKVIALVGNRVEARVALASGADGAFENMETPSRLIQIIHEVAGLDDDPVPPAKMPRDNWYLDKGNFKSEEEG